MVGYTNGCADTAVQAVTVYPIPTAAFTAPGPYTCGVPANLQMSNNSTNAGGYAWDFGNGTTSTGTDPVATYTAQGTYTVTLAASNHLGCSDTASSTVQIYADPAIQSFSIIPAQGCQPVLVNFAVNATNANTYVWNFGDGSPAATGPAVTTHLYTDTGSYLVTLEVYNFGNCADTIQIPDTVVVHSLPTAAFDYTMNDVIDSAIGQVQFINNSTNSTSYLWSFGDGDSSTLVNPSHTFPDIQGYIVKLVAANNFGCIDSTSKEINVIMKSLYVPNAFAPDFNAGSSLVQIWKPAGMGLLDYRAQIFNKWGELLWESTAITSDEMKMPAGGWDGTYQGKLCAQGVYVWKIEAVFLDGSRWKGMSYKFQDIKKTIGDVTLIR